MWVLDRRKLDFKWGSSLENHTKSDCLEKKIQLNPQKVDPRLGEVIGFKKLLFQKVAFRDQLRRRNRRSKSFSGLAFFLEAKDDDGERFFEAPLLLLLANLKKEAQNGVLVPTDNWQWNSACILAYSNGYKLNLIWSAAEQFFKNYHLIRLIASDLPNYESPNFHFNSVLYFLRIELLLSQTLRFHW